MCVTSRMIIMACIFIVFTDIEGVHSNRISPAADYCQMCLNHTMCLYPGSQPGKSCGVDHKPSPLLEVEITALLEAHNEHRDKIAMGYGSFSISIQPSAANMRAMRWDHELADLAQRWAEQCAGSNKDSCRDVKGYKVGQNIGQNMLSSKNGRFQSDIRSVVRSWYLEGESFDERNVDNFNLTDVEVSNASSYSQLVWAESDAVGCGRATVRRTSTETLVCNYAAAGNVDGGRVYEKGRAASGCPTDTTPDDEYLGLCYNKAWEKGKDNAIAASNYEITMKMANQNCGMNTLYKYWELLLAMLLAIYWPIISRNIAL